MAKHRFSLILVICGLVICSVAETSSDLAAAESIASSKTQTVAKYGYPYRIAPTLTPRIQSRSDGEDSGEPVYMDKSYGSRIGETADDDILLKKNSLKKSKHIYGTNRRQEEGKSAIQGFRSYREPSYRNFEELEASFQPRRMDINIPYSQYDYSKFVPKLSHSPRDPFLSPSDEPFDSFYPSTPKIKSYSSSSYGHRNKGEPKYGAGNYDEPHHYHSDDIPSRGSSYSRPSTSYSSSGGPTSNYPSSARPLSNYPSSDTGGYGYQDYAIKSNEPIMGDIRKRLLDYAGASDLYEGEPDYLQEVARNKYKYGNLGNDYYAYGGPGYKNSYREFPYVESKISLIKKSRRL